MLGTLQERTQDAVLNCTAKQVLTWPQFQYQSDQFVAENDAYGYSSNPAGCTLQDLEHSDVLFPPAADKAARSTVPIVAHGVLQGGETLAHHRRVTLTDSD